MTTHPFISSSAGYTYMESVHSMLHHSRNQQVCVLQQSLHGEG